MYNKPQNKNDDKCFQYAITTALSYRKIDNYPERILKVKQFLNQCNCDNIQFPPDQEDWSKFEINNKSIA